MVSDVNDGFLMVNWWMKHAPLGLWHCAKTTLHGEKIQPDQNVPLVISKIGGLLPTEMLEIKTTGQVTSSLASLAIGNMFLLIGERITWIAPRGLTNDWTRKNTKFSTQESTLHAELCSQSFESDHALCVQLSPKFRGCLGVVFMFFSPG